MSQDVNKLTSFISIDTETTGLDFERDRVIQFGCAVFINGKQVHQASFFIQTNHPNGGFEINQITQEQIDNGEPASQAFWMISKLLTKPINNTYPRVLAYNAPFDLGMLTNEFRRNNIEYDLKTCHIIDPLIIWRNFHPYQKGKLENVSQYYRIPNTKAHDAAADAACAGHIYLQMLERYTPIRDQYITEKQKNWHAKWKEGIEGWLERQGKEPNIEPWPTREEWMCFQVKRQSFELEL